MNVPNKAAASGIAGAAVTLIVTVLGAWNITVPPEVSGAATTLVAMLATYYTPHNGAQS